ncbi:hypothetical protein D5S18_17320 [Nocardia panacis]|uniref:Uncharacterized protein n=1 Tax=Nocardia panacis TaxID=2340916 RepID=A0A3A4KJP6_9NOCA|nr:hypothetical protein [Nocardia panacis]RJO75132.1 hypothetical protein D5S18_17320 [Nocardia panacis]
MSFFNIFTSAKTEAKSAQDSAQTLNRLIPGYRPESEGVDEELYDGLVKDPVRDPKIVKERSPEALTIVGSFLDSLFGQNQTVAESQRATSENPASTSGMASSVLGEVSHGTSSQGITVPSQIKDTDKPAMPPLPNVARPAKPDIPEAARPAMPDQPKPSAPAGGKQPNP